MAAISEYVKNQHSLFSKIANGTINKNNTESLGFTKTLTKETSYTEIARSVNLLEEDFNLLFEKLKRDKNNPDILWFYCYQCSVVLQNYYKKYGKEDAKEKYEEKALYIAAHLQKTKDHSLKNNDSYAIKLGKELFNDFSALFMTPSHSSAIKSQAGMINMMRLQLVFSKMFVRQFVMGFKDTQFLSRILGGQMGINHLITSLDKTTGVFNALSVGVFAARFSMDVGELLKHTIKNPENSELTLKERFLHELNVRHCDMANDFVWAAVNGVANYAQYFNIPAPVANWTMTGFVLFDISLQYYKHQLAYDIYKQKKDAYDIEREKNRNNPKLLDFITKQEQLLEQNWNVTEAKLKFNISGSLLLLGGLSASLLLTAARTVPVGFLMCTLAFAMFQSDKKYGEYKSKQFLKANDEEKNVLAARKDFVMTVTKNTVVPIGFMGLFAVSWPAALLLTVLYTGYFDYHQRACEDKSEVPGISPS